MTSPGARHSIEKAKTEVAGGRNWRAKEILQGAVAKTHADLEPEFLEVYGVLLDSMGDRFEAGKYLFLSGRRIDAYVDPIELFLDRTRRSHVNDLIAQFPAQIRTRGLGNLPPLGSSRI
jgi:hypothetical protein